MKIKFLKLINNERINKKLTIAKACVDPTATDLCGYIDNADCSVNAYDKCLKDYAGCTNDARDTCHTDYAGCFTSGTIDNCTTDVDAN